MHNDAINIAALGGKLAIEFTSLNRSAKEGIKIGIDLAADMTKLSQLLQQPNSFAMRFPLGNLQAIKQAARTYGLDRVLLYPCRVNGCWDVCFGMGGGDITGFCKDLGITQLENSSINVSQEEQERLINAYGITLFLRSDEEQHK